MERIPPGHLLRFSGQDFTKQLLTHSLAELRDSSFVSSPPQELMQEALAHEMEKVPADSALFFSGGVDSGLLAALAKRQGKSNLRLINCDFSPSLDTGVSDLEARQALDMAAHLGYKLDVFPFNFSCVPTMLDSIGRDYTFPFADYSTITTNLLAHYAASVSGAGSWVVDGTGADGIFFCTYSWNRLNWLYRVPSLIRRLLSLPFQHKMVFNRIGRISSHLGVIHQSLLIPSIQLEVITQNRLAGIAFLAKKEIVFDVLQAQKNYLQSLILEFDLRSRLALFDLIYICIGIYAAKDYDPLRFHRLVPFFPFLSEKVISAGLSIMRDQRELQENKRVLKSLLLRYVPYEMIYRPKSGFTPPLRTILMDYNVRAYMNDMVLSPNNPLREFVFPHIVRQLFQRIWNSKEICEYHLNFLWSYIFASIWLDQQRRSPPEATDEKCSDPLNLE